MKDTINTVATGNAERNFAMKKKTDLIESIKSYNELRERPTKEEIENFAHEIISDENLKILVGNVMKNFH